MTDPPADHALGAGFLASCERFPQRHALEVAGQHYTYTQLREYACALAAALQKQPPTQGSTDDSTRDLTAILAHRSVTAFAGILAALLQGGGYVPLNPNFPVARTSIMLQRSACRRLIVGDEALPVLAGLLSSLPESLSGPLLILLPASKDIDYWRIQFPQHTFLGQEDLCTAENWRPVKVKSSDIAYLLFTSGSTGNPKGVQITHANIRHFIKAVVARYEITEDDRFSQLFELVFDLSLFDMFVAWECGACICCPSQGDAQLPARFIIESAITIWFSVPSLVLSMQRLRMLRPGLYPQLRLSLFCGEALLNDSAEQWAKAAPNSVIENLYGPTEVTLACTWYRWEAHRSEHESMHGIVPIGTPFPGMTALVVDEQLHEVPLGQAGELLLSGPQVALGYWQDPVKTAAAFVAVPGKNSRYYRTGDRVVQPQAGQPLQYLGRIDQQIKIRGHRVELGEIEAVLREVAGVEMAVALGWPLTPAGADGIVVFMNGCAIDMDSVRAQANAKLPTYMVPQNFHLLNDMPLNSNGKVDRKSLLDLLGNPNGSAC